MTIAFEYINLLLIYHALIILELYQKDGDHTFHWLWAENIFEELYASYW